jgi:hypothetical protein
VERLFPPVDFRLRALHVLHILGWIYFFDDLDDDRRCFIQFQRQRINEHYDSFYCAYTIRKKEKKEKD